MRRFATRRKNYIHYFYIIGKAPYSAMEVQWCRDNSGVAERGVLGTNPAGHKKSFLPLFFLRFLGTLFSMLANRSIFFVHEGNRHFSEEKDIAGYHMRQFMVCFAIDFLQCKSAPV